MKTFIRSLCALAILLSSTLKPYSLSAAPIEMSGDEAPRPIESGNLPPFSPGISPAMTGNNLPLDSQESEAVPNSSGLHASLDSGLRRNDEKNNPSPPQSVSGGPDQTLQSRSIAPSKPGLGVDLDSGKKGDSPFFNFGFNKNDQKPESRVWAKKIAPLIDSAKPWMSGNLGSVDDIGIQDPALSAVNEEFSELYEKLKNNPPRGT